MKSSPKNHQFQWSNTYQIQWWNLPHFCQLWRSTASSCIEAWTIRLGRPGLEGMENVAISHQWTLLGYIICLTIAGRYRDVSSKKKCIHNITLMYCSEGSFQQAASCVSHLDIYTFVHRFKCNVWGPRKTNHVIFADWQVLRFFNAATLKHAQLNELSGWDMGSECGSWLSRTVSIDNYLRAES